MNRQEAISRPFLAYAGLIGVLAVGCLAASLTYFPPRFGADVLLLFLAVVLAEALAVALPGGGSASLSYPLSVAATVLLGPTAGAVAALLSGVNVDDIRRRRHPAVWVFNLGQVTLASLASGWLYLWTGGRTILTAFSGLVTGPFQPADFPGVAGASIVLVTTSLALNAVLVTFAVSLLRQVPLSVVWRNSISWAIPMQGTLGLLGFAIAQILATSQVAFALFFFPLVVARQLYQRYVGLRDAYLDTVRSLVAAIEAKDPYTRGHSERVADFAKRLSQALELSEAQVERIEFSALLHDLGKIGISSRILAKCTRLTDSEFDEVRRHPTIGASILASVPYLSDVVPAVVSHHERYDGNGYSVGLAGDAVPLEARILAVADAWDAMTSERPYRPALTHEQALAELRAQAGKQFDPELVVKFTEVIDPTVGITAIDLNLAAVPGGTDG